MKDLYNENYKMLNKEFKKRYKEEKNIRVHRLEVHH